MATKSKKKVTKSVQEVCIDLPGEAVQCWRSSDHIKVRLRKHRDVFFDINLTPNAIYAVESTSDFYSPRERKLLRQAFFTDGEQFNVWVGRNFNAHLVLKSNGLVIGKYKVNELDSKKYSSDPKVKPEPLMVIMGERRAPVSHMCAIDDPFGVGATQESLKISFDKKLSILKKFGSEFDYRYPIDPPEIKEYVAVTEAFQNEIQSQVLKQLDSGMAVVGSPAQIFLVPKSQQQPSLLHIALARAAGYISGSPFWTDNTTKESLGYLQENFRALDKISMTVRVEAKAKGKYRVALKGHPLTTLFGEAAGVTRRAKIAHENFVFGSKGSEFLDGGFARTGKSGYGGIRRMVLTTAEKFGAGMKIQVIGTVIDLIVDVNTVYFDEKGSKDFTEFLGRAGVSIAKAGATAAIGSMFAAFGMAVVTGIAGAGAAPVVLVVLAVVAGYILAATLVDKIDDGFNIKNGMANWAR